MVEGNEVLIVDKWRKSDVGLYGVLALVLMKTRGAWLFANAASALRIAMPCVVVAVYRHPRCMGTGAVPSPC